VDTFLSKIFIIHYLQYLELFVEVILNFYVFWLNIHKTNFYYKSRLLCQNKIRIVIIIAEAGVLILKLI
jgi:hypothetical protein